jgi:hypothetical protein
MNEFTINLYYLNYILKVYCDNPHKMSGIVPKTPEDAITQFLHIVLIGQNFRWRTSSTRPQVYENISCKKSTYYSN